VDTSVGVRIDAERIAKAADECGVLSVFDGVCATAGEEFLMSKWGADVYLTASQKAIGVPPGLALMVFSEAALERRNSLDSEAVPMYIDWKKWLPIMESYRNGEAQYFSTPPTNLIHSLNVSLGEILDRSMRDTFALHQRTSEAVKSAFAGFGFPTFYESGQRAHTMTALSYPDSSTLVKKVEQATNITLAGGLLDDKYFRVGHMGWITTRPDLILTALRKIGDFLVEEDIIDASQRRDGLTEATFLI
jgi:alanine-glyoxylate transaminase/serine-glyoxylate transaminase/serine-pyruvate transaminase